jgi:GNAT superfamily N-acetyltransferase
MTTFSSTLVVRPVELSDLHRIKEILVASIPAGKEVDHAMQSIVSSLNNANSVRYYVASSSKAIYGLMGITDSNIDPQLCDSHEKPIELVNAYVQPRLRARGVGGILADKLEQIAIDEGYTKLIIVSGSRNRVSGYPFWRKRYGEPTRIDPDYWGATNERVVWTKKIA